MLTYVDGNPENNNRRVLRVIIGLRKPFASDWRRNCCRTAWGPIGNFLSGPWSAGDGRSRRRGGPEEQTDDRHSATALPGNLPGEQSRYNNRWKTKRKNARRRPGKINKCARLYINYHNRRLVARQTTSRNIMTILEHFSELLTLVVEDFASSILIGKAALQLNSAFLSRK